MTSKSRFEGEIAIQGEPWAAGDSPALRATIDEWLTHHLRQLYGPVVDGPTPCDLIKLLEQKLG